MSQINIYLVTTNVDQVEWNNGIYVVETEDETVVLIEILDVLEEQPKKLSR